jgi:hypothetical protein
MQSLIGTGAPINSGMLRAGSPIGTLLGSASSAGLKAKGARAFSDILDNVYLAIQRGKSSGWTAAQISDKIKGSNWYQGYVGGTMQKRRAGQQAGYGGASGFTEGTPFGVNPSIFTTTTDEHGYETGVLGNEQDIREVMDPFGFFGKGGSSTARRKKRGANVLQRLASTSGYESLQDLIQAQLDFDSQIEGRVNDANSASQAAATGRNDALRRIAELQSGFVSPTEDQINARSSEIENILRAQIAREFDDRDKAALYQANAYGINPAGQMGRLGEGRAIANLAAGPDALARTLQLLGGEQGLQTNAINTLQGSINAQDQLPLALLGIQSNNNVSLSNIASNQALQLAQIQSQQNQILGNGITGLANQLGAIPGLLSERNRGSQLNSIDRFYGLSPGVRVTSGPQNPNDYGY